MKRNTAFLRRCVALFLVLILCFSLVGCRESPVLRQVLYQHNAPEIDEEEEMLDPEDEGKEDEQFENEKDEDAETERDSEASQGLENQSQPPETDQSMDVDYSPVSGQDWQSGDSPTDASQGNTGSADGLNTDGKTDGETTEVPELEAGDADALRQIVDGSGRLVELPKNVDTVTAVRWAAQMTEMLGGSGRLLAADSDFLSSPLAKAAFSDLGSVRTLWPGSGDEGITASDFTALLDLKPDVCFAISGEHTFTEAQVRQLSDAGITYVVLPALTNADTLKQAVNLIASVLGTNHDTGTAASSIAASYSAWVDRIISSASGKVPDNCTSLYISEWDSSASYVLDHTKGVFESKGSGLAIAYSPTKPQLVSTFMKAAGVVNESTRIMSIHRDSELVYVAPMFHQFDPVVSGKKALFYSGAGEYGAAYDLFVARMVSDSLYYQLGGSQYPAVIVADEEVKAQLEDNWFWQYHEIDGNGYVTISGESFYCGVVGTYDIYVNPQGMCDWAEGSVESPLEACWVAYRFGTGYTLDQVRNETSAFYQQFFGLTLTNEQLDSIFTES